jgi:hypothetical protein
MMDREVSDESEGSIETAVLWNRIRERIIRREKDDPDGVMVGC